MSTRTETFAVGERTRVEASTTAGDVVVTAAPAGTVTVLVDGSRAEEYVIEQRGDVVTVEPAKGVRRWLGGADIHLEVPPTATLELSCTSGDITVNSAVLELVANVASGDIRVDDVARSARIKSASGDVFVDRVGERLDVSTASGTLRIGTVGRDVSVTTASGDTYIDRVGETVNLRSASGDVEVTRFDGTDFKARTLSGDVRIGIPSRRLLDVDIQTLSGELRNRLREGDESPPERSASLQLKTVSGDVTLQGA